MGKKKKNKETKVVEQEKPQLDSFIIIILALTFLIPVLVAPFLLDNIFNLPKTLLIFLGAFIMIAIYCVRFVLGDQVRYPKTTTPVWLILIVLLNFISFFYTQNYYYTKVAVLMNICALAIFYFTSLYVDTKKSIWILSVIALSGIIVSLVAVLQFTDSPMLFRWLKTGAKTTGTIGNSNYLGAYLLFPLISMAGLIFLLKGIYRPITAALSILVFIALLFAKARASWLGLFIALPVLLILIKMIYRFSVLEYIKLNPRRVFISIVITISVIAILSAAMPERFYPEMKEKGLRISTFTQRLQFFHASLELLKENPIFGTGLWSYRNCVYRAQAKIIESNPDYFKGADRPNKPKRAHNEYLEALNDGGLLAAAILLIFFLIVMGHGLKVIRDQETDTQTRVVASIAFSALIAIIIDAFFFFPFRINTTLFLTALTLGLLEGIYANRYKLISKSQGKELPFSPALVCLIIFMLVSVLWFRGYRPLKAEMEHFEFKKALFQKDVKKAETHILNSISYDPGNTRYHIYAGMMYINNFRNYPKAGELIEESLINFIGDNTLWGVYYTKGLVKFQTGSLFQAREAFQKSLYYNPIYEPSLQKLAELEKIFKKHDKICIQLK